MRIPSIFHLQEPHRPNRIVLLDFLRGCGMLLVLIHHSNLPNPYGRWILAFHMPLLFLLSGYTTYLRAHTSRFTVFLQGRFLRLILPYFLFEGVNLLVWSVSLFLQGGWQDVTDAVTAILACVNTEGYSGYYGRLWFWPCMFVSDLYFYWILQFAPKNHHRRQCYLAAAILIMLGISWITCRLLPFRLPFTADTACMATAFILTGYLFGSQISWLLQKSRLFTDIVLLTCALLAMGLAIMTETTSLLMYINEYGHYGYTLCAAYSGILVFLIIAKWLYRLCASAGFLKSLILWYGYHSLGTFPVHLSIKIWICQSLPPVCRSWYILLPAMLLINIPIVNLIEKYFPFMLGNRWSFPHKAKASQP